MFQNISMYNISVYLITKCAMGSLKYQMQISIKKDSMHGVSSQEYNNQSTLDGCNMINLPVLSWPGVDLYSANLALSLSFKIRDTSNLLHFYQHYLLFISSLWLINLFDPQHKQYKSVWLYAFSNLELLCCKLSGLLVNTSISNDNSNNMWQFLLFIPTLKRPVTSLYLVFTFIMLY